MTWHLYNQVTKKENLSPLIAVSEDERVDVVLSVDTVEAQDCGRGLRCLTGSVKRSPTILKTAKIGTTDVSPKQL